MVIITLNTLQNSCSEPDIILFIKEVYIEGIPSTKIPIAKA